MLGDFLNISQEFFDELESFAERNKIIYENNPHGRVCLLCFKAFLMEKTEEYYISGREKNIILGIFHCEAGHSNHFLDAGELKSVKNTED